MISPPYEISVCFMEDDMSIIYLRLVEHGKARIYTLAPEVAGELSRQLDQAVTQVHALHAAKLPVRTIDVKASQH